MKPASYCFSGAFLSSCRAKAAMYAAAVICLLFFAPRSAGALCGCPSGGVLHVNDTGCSTSQKLCWDENGKSGNATCQADGTSSDCAGATQTLYHEVILVSGYGDVAYLNLVREHENYKAYEGISTYKGFSLSGCSLFGNARAMYIKPTAAKPAQISMTLTATRYDTTVYILDESLFWYTDAQTTLFGYENWYPFSMSCSITWYLVKGGF